MALGQSTTRTSTPTQLKSTGSLSGFRVSDECAKARLLANIQGLEKTGKNHLAFTAPGPLAVLSFDLGIEGVIEKFNKPHIAPIINGLVQKRIYVAEYELSAQPGQATDSEVEAEATKLWKQVTSDFKDALASDIRTLICDTGTELWELKRLSEFGKMSANVQHYGPVNADFRRLLRLPYDTDKNFIMIHKMKDEWADRAATGKAQKTGKLERSGFKDVGYLLQANIQTWRDDSNPAERFHATVLDCRQNPDVNGMDFTGEMLTWAMIGQMVFPDSDPEAWL